MTKIIVTLSNGKRIGNFSSHHEFIFTDGTILPGVSQEECERLAVTFHELVDKDGDTMLSFSLNTDVKKEMAIWLDKWFNDEVDVVICPLPMIDALKNEAYHLKASPFRSCRMENRITKSISINKQCI